MHHSNGNPGRSSRRARNRRHWPDAPAYRAPGRRAGHALPPQAQALERRVMLSTTPTVSFGNLQAYACGMYPGSSSFSLSVSASDLGTAAVTSYVIDWGDGYSDTVTTGDASTSLYHWYNWSGDFTVSATVYTDDGGVGYASTPAKSMSFGYNGSTYEGSSYGISGGALGEGANSISSWNIDWGDGTTDVWSYGQYLYAEHTYADDGYYSVTATSNDGSFSYNGPVEVLNAMPYVAGGGTFDGYSQDGTVFALSANSCGPANEPLSWYIEWGDGTSSTANGTSVLETHQYAAMGSYTVNVTGTDDDGSSSSFQTVAEVRGAVASGVDGVVEGTAFTPTISACGPGAETVTTWAIDWGDGTTESVSGSGGSALPEHTYADDGYYTLTYSGSGSGFTYNGTSQVSVMNAPPVLHLDGYASTGTSGSSTYYLSLSAEDPGSDWISSYLIDWGDGTSETLTGSTYSVAHQYTSVGTLPITVTATDEDGTWTAYTQTESNFAILNPTGGAVEGAETGVWLSACGPAAAAITAWSIDWGDGTTEVVQIPGDGLVTHTYADDGVYNFSAYADTAVGGASVPLEVADVAPTLNVTGSACGVGAAESIYQVYACGTDPGLDTISNWTIDWGDGSAPESLPGGPEVGASRAYASPGSYTVTLTATDEHGQHVVQTESKAVSVSAWCGPWVEGSGFQLGLGAIGPDAGSVSSWTIYWGDGTSGTITGSGGVADHVYADDGEYSVYYSSPDYAYGGYFPVSVGNVPPSLLVDRPATATEGVPYRVNLSASDPGADAISSWEINWGDGSDPEQVPGDATSATHTYAKSGRFVVSVKAADDDGTWVAPPALDSGFGTGGRIVTDFPGGHGTVPAHAVVQPDGGVVVAGNLSDSFFLARYLADGSPDESFGTDGRFQLNTAPWVVRLTLAPDGSLLVAGNSGTSMYVARVLPNGTLDQSFGAEGWANAEFAAHDPSAAPSLNAAIVQADGRILLAGTHWNGNPALAMARFNADGTPDTSFGTGGKAWVPQSATAFPGTIALQSDGRIVAASGSGGDFRLTRYNADGSPDHGGAGDATPGDAFGTSGSVVDPVGTFVDAYSVAVDADDRIVLAGVSAGNFAIARYLPDGTRDASFGTDGLVVHGVGAYGSIAGLTLLNDGGLVVAGMGWSGTLLARYTADGVLHDGFGDGGILPVGAGVAASAFVVHPTGRIVIAGAAGENLAVYGANVQLDGYHPDNAVEVTPVLVGLTAEPLSTTSIKLTWADAYPGARQRTIERSVDGATWTLVTSPAGAGGGSFTDTGLEAGGEYVYRAGVGAGDDVRYDAVIDAATLPAAPAAPADLVVVGTTDRTASLRWADGSNNEWGFRVERSTGGGAWAAVGGTGADVTAFTDAGVAPGGSYLYRVVAYNNGGASAPLGPVTADAAPAVPAGLTAAVGSTGVELAWAAAAGAAGYRVQRSVDGGPFAPLADLSAGTTEHVDESIAAGTRYAYRAQAYRGPAASPWGGGAVATPPRPAPPAPPRGAAGAPPPTAPRLTWDAPPPGAEDARLFRLERAPVADGMTGAWAVAAEQVTSRRAFEDRGLAARATYAYRLSLVGGDGTASEPTGVTKITTHPEAPAAPADVKVTAADPLEGGASGGAVIEWNVPATGPGAGTPGVVYRVLRSTDNVNFTEVATLPASAGTPGTTPAGGSVNLFRYADTTATAEGTAYYYQISAEIPEDDGTGGGDDGTAHPRLTAAAVARAAYAKPTITASGLGSVKEGEQYTLNLKASIPGLIRRWVIDFGDGPKETFEGNPPVAQHTYADNAAGNGAFTIKAEAVTAFGSFPAPDVEVTVRNVNPTARLKGRAVAVEGDVIRFDAYGDDVAGLKDPLTTTWAVARQGGNEQVEVGNPTPQQAEFVPKDNGRYTVTATVTDDDGGSVSVSRTVVVGNAAPSLGSSSSQPGNDGGETVTYTGADPGEADLDGLKWEYKLGGTSKSGTGKTFEVDVEAPTELGIHSGTLKITDKDGASSESSLTSVAGIDDGFGPEGDRSPSVAGGSPIAATGADYSDAYYGTFQGTAGPSITSAGALPAGTGVSVKFDILMLNGWDGTEKITALANGRKVYEWTPGTTGVASNAYEEALDPESGVWSGGATSPGGQKFDDIGADTSTWQEWVQEPGGYDHTTGTYTPRVTQYTYSYGNAGLDDKGEISFNFLHSSEDALNLTFEASGLDQYQYYTGEGAGGLETVDNAWAIDNLRVDLSPGPRAELSVAPFIELVKPPAGGDYDAQHPPASTSLGMTWPSGGSEGARVELNVSGPVKVYEGDAQYGDASAEVGSSKSWSVNAAPSSFTVYATAETGLEGVKFSMTYTAPDPGGDPADPAVLVGTFEAFGSATVLSADLNVDSDNNDGNQGPQGTAEEEEAEAVDDDPEKPGKLIPVNDADPDKDGVPGFWDGYDSDKTGNNPTAADDSEAGSTSFFPVKFTLPVAAGDDATVAFDYAGEAPDGNREDGAGSGGIRLWRNKAAQRKRDAVLAEEPGDWVRPGDPHQSGSGIFSGSAGLLYVEGVGEGVHPIVIHVDPDGGGPAPTVTDTVLINVVRAGIDIDTLNAGLFAGPSGSRFVDGLEDVKDTPAALPGKLIDVNGFDADRDGIPDFADGFDRDGADNTDDDESVGSRLVPLRFHLSPQIDLTKAKLRIKYDAYDGDGDPQVPGDAVQTANDGDRLVYRIEPRDGPGLRLWTGNGTDPRRNESFTERGDENYDVGYYIPPNDGSDSYGPDDLKKLGLKPEPPEGGGSVHDLTLWVEGINNSKELADARISVEVSPLGDDTFVAVDAVRLTVGRQDVDIDSDNNDDRGGPSRDPGEEEIEAEEDKPGKYVAVNDADRDNDLIPDYADGYDRYKDPATDEDDDLDYPDDEPGPMVPVVIELPAWVDLSKAKLKLRYNGSNPETDVTRRGAGTPEDPYVYSAPQQPGARLWSSDANGELQQRTQRAITDKKDQDTGLSFYVPPEEEGYGGEDLKLLGFKDDKRSITLWLEPIGETKKFGSTYVEIEIDPGLDQPPTEDGYDSEELPPKDQLTDRVTYTAVRVDVDVDSDNTAPDGKPKRVAYEDQIEDYENTGQDYADRTVKPGRYVPVNASDVDDDGIPDFADGYNRDGVDADAPNPAADDDETGGLTLTPIEITLPIKPEPGPDSTTPDSKPVVDKDVMTFRIRYNDSNPAEVTRTGSGTSDDPFVYAPPMPPTPPAGQDPETPERLRLWTRPKDAPFDSVRTSASVKTRNPLDNAKGYFVPANEGEDKYLPGDLAKFGFSEQNPTVTLYAEGVLPSGKAADEYILVEVDPDGDAGPAEFMLADRVRVTVVGANVVVDSDNTAMGDPEPDKDERIDQAQDQIEDDPTLPGKIVLVNDADRDGDEVPDFADGYSGSPGGTGGPSRFVPVLVHLPAATDPRDIVLTFEYNASIPKAESKSDKANPGYVPNNGLLRLWKKDGSESRSPDKASTGSNGGDFVTPGDEFTAEALGADLNDPTKPLRLFLEGVRPSDKVGDQLITATFKLLIRNPRTASDEPAPDTGSGGGSPSPTPELLNNLPLTDAVRVTVMQDNVANDFSGAVRLFDGAVNFSTTDVLNGGFGLPWGHGRTFTNEVGFGLKKLNGNGWEVDDLPYLIQGTSAMIAVRGGAAEYFDFNGNPGAPVWTPRFDSKSKLTYSGAADGSGEFTLSDPAGGTAVFYGFKPTKDGDEPFPNGIPAPQRGMLKSYTGPGGQVINVTYTEKGLPKEVKRGEDLAFKYEFNPPPVPGVDPPAGAGQLNKLEMHVKGQVARAVQFEYYGKGDADGNHNDLKRVTVKQGSKEVEKKYYRYAKNPAPPSDGKTKRDNPPRPKLEVVVEPDLHARLKTPDTMSLAELKKRADHTFGYSGDRVQEQTIQGAGPTDQTDPTKSDAGTFKYGYDDPANRPVGVNNWRHHTTVTLPSGATSETYANFAGQTMLTTAAGKWHSLTRYNKQHRPVLTANPSAVKEVKPKEWADLANMTSSSGDGSYEGLHDDRGLIRVFTYDPDSGRVAEEHARRGDGEGAEKVHEASYVYQSQSVNDYKVYYLNKHTVYKSAAGGGSDPVTTTIDRGDYERFQPKKVTTTLPPVTTTHEGPTAGTTVEEVFDKYGQLKQVTDADGYVHTTSYDDPTGGVTGTTTMVAAAGGGGAAATTISTSAVVDLFGRPTSMTNPKGVVTSIAYVDEIDQRKVTATTAGRPTVITREDLDGGWVDTRAEVGSGGDVTSLVRETLDHAGRVVYVDKYTGHTEGAYAKVNGYDENAAGPFGAKDVDHYRSTKRYDKAGRLDKLTNFVGTATEEVFDQLGRTTAIKKGVDDHLQVVTTFEFDGGADAVGDGNVTTAVDIPGAGNNRKTELAYDWRNRLVLTQAAAGDASTVSPVTELTLNNLGQATKTAVYTGGAGVAQATRIKEQGGNATGGVPTLPSAGGATRRAESTTEYDYRGRAAKTSVFSVDPVTGDLGGALDTNYKYDGRDNPVRTTQPTGAAVTAKFDGAGRQVEQGLLGDGILTRTVTTYDAVGNPTLVAATERGLGGEDRTSYVANYYDSADRLTETVNVGTNGGGAFSYGGGAGSRSDQRLITSYAYDAAGRVEAVTDPNGVVTGYANDALDRPISVTQNKGGGADERHVTFYEYNGLDLKTKVRVSNVVPPTADKPRQSTNLTTEYKYQVRAGGEDSTIDSNDLLSEVIYPGRDKGNVIATQEKYGYNAMGERTTWTDRSNNRHTYAYDALGRLTSDSVRAGHGVSNNYSALQFGFDAAGRATTFTSLGNNGTISNQVVRTYNGFGQVLKEQQAHGGQVDANTVAVQYEYGGPGSVVHKMTYPDGRAVSYGHDSVGRVTSVHDGATTAATTLESYKYLGAGSILERTRPQANLRLAVGLDTFSRVNNVQWVRTDLNAVADQYTYNFDRVGNITHRSNATAPTALSRARSYDKLYNLKSFGSNSWANDAQGNRYGGRYPSKDTYNEFDLLDAGASANATVVKLTEHTFAPQEIVLRYDAFGRVVESRAAAAGTINPVRYYEYDALGRMISVKLPPPSGSQTFPTTRFVYDGQQVIEDRDQAGRVINHYVRAPDGQLILRDRDRTPGQVSDQIPNVGGTGLDERIYSTFDAEGNITALTNITGGVIERFDYDENGMPTFYKANWDHYQATRLIRNAADFSPYDWQYLSKGGRWQPMDHVQSTRRYVTGLYTFGGTFYDPRHGRSLQPDPMAYAAGRNAYDSGISDFHRNFAMGGMIAVGILAGIATGGAATMAMGYFGVGAVVGASGVTLTAGGTFAAGVASGTVGGAVMGGLHGYGDTGTLAGAAKGAAIGAAAGAAGGVAGGLGGIAVRAAGLTCQRVGTVAAGFASGAVEGAVGGYVGGFVQGGLSSGTLDGAFDQAASDGLVGFGVGGVLGAIFHKVCFVAGTRVAVGFEPVWVHPQRDEVLEKRCNAVPAGLEKGGIDALGTLVRPKYATRPIEELVARGGGELGDGAAQYVLARHEHNPGAPLVRRRIVRTYERTAYHLQALTLRDTSGNEQTLRVTDEHPFYRTNDSLGGEAPMNAGWTPARALAIGDEVLGDGDALKVIDNEGTDYAQGVKVYNLEIEEDHTYFVQAADAPAESDLVWVHNADPEYDLRSPTGEIDDAVGQDLFANARSLRSEMPGRTGMKLSDNVATARITVNGEESTVRRIIGSGSMGARTHPEVQILDHINDLRRGGDKVRLLAMFSDRTPCSSICLPRLNQEVALSGRFPVFPLGAAGGARSEVQKIAVAYNSAGMKLSGMKI